MTKHYRVTEPPSTVAARAERLLDRHVETLRLDPRPTVRFVKRTTSSENVIAIPGLAALEEAAGFVRRAEPNVIYLNVEAPLAQTLAHEARHVWQAQQLTGDMWARSATRTVEADADEYASVTTLRQSLAGVLLGLNTRTAAGGKEQL